MELRGLGGLPYRSCGRGVQVDGTPHVRSGGIDGRVQTEACGVHGEAAAALLHHLSQDVHLDLGSEEENRLRTAGSGLLSSSTRGPSVSPAHVYP